MADTERPYSRRSTSPSDVEARDPGMSRAAAVGDREGTARTSGRSPSAVDVETILDAMRRVLRSTCPPSPGDDIAVAGAYVPLAATAAATPEPGEPVGSDTPTTGITAGLAGVASAAGEWLLDTAHGSATDAPPDASSAATRTGSRHRAGPRGGDHDEAETSRVMALVDLAKKGDAEAFGQLYDHYVSTIYRYIYYRVGTYALAEDLTSETFLRALRALASFKWQGRDFGAWLVTIARNLVADHYKSGRFRLEVATGEILDHDSVSDGPEDDVLASITNETLMQALRELGSEQQECLVLRFLNGLSVAETALALGKSEGAIKQLQLRAIRNLAKQLPDGFR